MALETVDNPALAQTPGESLSGRNRTRDPHTKRGRLILPEFSLEVTSATPATHTIPTPQGSMKEGPSREIARLNDTRLSFQFRVCSLWHSPKQLFLIR